MAFILMHYDWSFQEAEKEFQRAIALNPGYVTSHQWHAINLLVTGHPNDAIEELTRAQALDPTSLIVMADQAQIYIYTGHLKEAEAAARRALRLDPAFELARLWLALALLEQNRFEESESMLKDKTEDSLQLSLFVYAAARSGHVAEGKRR